MKKKTFELNPGSNPRPLEFVQVCNSCDPKIVKFNRHENQYIEDMPHWIEDESIAQDTSSRMANLSAIGRFGHVYNKRH